MNETLIAEAILGRDSEEFIQSELGRYVLGRAEGERQEALAELARVSPWRRNRIRHLQNVIWRAESVGGWLSELITNGRQAEAVLEEERT